MSLPPPAPYTLLPPLLACLPTAFASTRPPPALLPLLSPILRQRTQLLSGSASSPSDSWLTKLSWDPSKAEALASIVESEAFELHPVSNEIEFDDVQNLGYRRLDEETLQSRIDIRDLGLTVIYLWCVGDTEGGGDGWRVAEVLPIDSEDNLSTIWKKSVQEADKACTGKQSSTTTTSDKSTDAPPNDLHSTSAIDNDDDYWAQYDAAPSDTPGPNLSPGPQQTPKASRHGRTLSDAEYFSQYSHVQPDMDNDDPSADRSAIGESFLNGDTITSTVHNAATQSTPQPPFNERFAHEDHISAPQPSHTAVERSETASSNAEGSDSSPVVDKLEGSAMMQSQTELAVRQHVASTMKSLYRLARSTGMEMADFEKVVHMEVEMLRFEEGMEEG
ncbi:MAG: hypothetical protein L6R40_006676 [Gallowayella cf. fulva]|nr:MAG: hypothetical protein L6R40_006676 [Xanthomendoza cf. fulva]